MAPLRLGDDWDIGFVTRPVQVCKITVSAAIVAFHVGCKSAIDQATRQDGVPDIIQIHILDGQLLLKQRRQHNRACAGCFHALNLLYRIAQRTRQQLGILGSIPCIEQLNQSPYPLLRYALTRLLSAILHR